MLQKTIVELERTAADAEDYKPYYTLSQDFTNKHEPAWGSNVDIIRRVQNDDGSIARKSRELLEGFVPRILPDLDHLGRLFFEFKTDEQAEIYFEKVLELGGTYEPEGVKNLLSFGANEALLGDDKEQFSFPNIERLAKELDSTYVDSLRLPPLAASYKLEPEKKGDVKHPRNIFWAKYYQKAMREATTMVFVITAGWLGSINCWEEMGWAAEQRKRNAKMQSRSLPWPAQSCHHSESSVYLEQKCFLVLQHLSCLSASFQIPCYRRCYVPTTMFLNPQRNASGGLGRRKKHWRKSSKSKMNPTISTSELQTIHQIPNE